MGQRSLQLHRIRVLFKTAIARVQAKVQIWKQELHSTEFTRNTETEIQDRIFSCIFVIFSDMCVPQ